jgi:PKD repeat protein
MKKTTSGIMLTLLFVGMLTLAFNIQPVNASGTIDTRADGRQAIKHQKKEVINLSFSEPQVAKNGEYNVLRMPNCSYISVSGHPQLPMKSVVVRLPLGSDLISIDVNVKTLSLDKAYYVPPASRPLPLNSPSNNSNVFGDPDSSIYESNELYPKHWYDYRAGNGIDPETQKRVKHVIVYFYPLRYFPTQRKILSAQNATIEVVYEEPVEELVEQGELDNLVITSTLLYPQALSLAQWRNSTGVLTRIVTTDWIYGHYDGVDHQEMIRNCIKDFVSKHGIVYVTIFGDVDQVPVRYAYVPDEYDTLVPTDLYYADLDGSWDDNGDGLYADIENDVIDGVPDVYIGRVPPSFVETAKEVVDKILGYEQNLNISDDWFNRILLSGTDAFSEYEGPEGEILQEDIASLWRAGNGTRLYETDGTLTSSILASEFNKGCSFASFAGHGNPDAWAIGEWFFGLLPVLWSSSNVRVLANEFRLPVVTAMACSTAQFDTVDCIGEWFLMNPNGGAIGYFGATRVAWAYVGESIKDGLLGEMVWQVYQTLNEGYSRLGEMWGISVSRYVQRHPIEWSIYDEKTVMEYILFGDPSLFIPVRINRHPIDMAVVSVSPYTYNVIDDLYYLGCSYDFYDENKVAELFGGSPAEIYKYDVVLSGSYTFTSTTYPEEAEAIRSIFEENAAILKDYVETGGGLIILAEHDYSWLPIELGAYTDLGNRTGGEINYYSEHAIVKSPNYLKPYGGSQTHVPKDDLYVHHFSIWENKPIGTRYGIYESVARDDWTWESDVTTWLAGNMGKGKITLTTMLLDYHSGNEDVEWKTLYRARLAISNMIWWAAGFVKFEFQTPHESIVLSIDGSLYATNSMGEVLGVIAQGSYIATVQSPVITAEDIRSVFVQWSDGSTSNPRMVDIMSDLIIGVLFQDQYYLTVDSTYGFTSGYGWKDAGTYTYAMLNSNIVEGEEGTRYVFTEWSGDAAGENFNQSNPIYMDGPKEAIANWKTQFYLSADTNPSGLATIQVEGWYDNGTSIDLYAPSLVESGVGTRHLFANWTLDDIAIASNPVQVLMNAPHEAVANYKTQYRFSVASSGLPTDVSFTFLYGTSTPPIMSQSLDGGSTWTSGWYDAGTTIYLDVGSNSKVIKSDEISYVFGSWNQTFPITLDNYEIFSAYFSAQPVASFTCSPTVPLVGEKIAFNASSSYDVDEDIVSYLWDFDDGNISSTVTPIIVHNYTFPRTYNVTLTVTDATGLNSSISQGVPVKMPTSVSVFTSSPSTFVGFKVNITGTLRDKYGNGLRNETVVLSYTFSGIGTWTPITSDTTDNLGNYFAMWVPPATGYFVLKAEWGGNATHFGASNTTTLSSLVHQNQYVFSVESNSSISELYFNTTDWTLSFTASGPNGTKGYVKVTAAKSLAANPENVRVYLEGNQIEYSMTSTDDSWLLTFIYMHSTHQVAVDLDINIVPEFPLFLILPLFTIATLLAVTLYRRKHSM